MGELRRGNVQQLQRVSRLVQQAWREPRRIPHLLNQRIEPYRVANLSRPRRYLRAHELDGFKRALAASLGTRASVTPTQRVLRRVVDVLAGHADTTIDHRAATDLVAEASEALQGAELSVALWFTLEEATRSVGLFSASSTFTRRAFAAIERECLRSPGLEAGLRSVLVSIHRGDLDETLEKLTRLCPSWQRDVRACDLVPATVEDDLYLSIAYYTALWSGDALERRPGGSANGTGDRTAWQDAVEARNIVIYGPAPTSVCAEDLPPDPLVARIAARGVMSWPSADACGGRADIAYLNRRATEWISTCDDRSMLETFRFVNGFTAIASRDDAPILRVSAKPRRLYLSGSTSPNMVPVALFDVLLARPANVYVMGATFFTTSVAHRPESRPMDAQTGVRVTPKGSTGHYMAMCTDLAEQNATQNRALVRNLLLADVIDGDADVRRAVTGTDEDYLATLDAIYGRTRV